MNSLQQYINIYKENKSLVESGLPETINSLRNEALQWLEKNQLPPKGSENYETIDLSCILEPDYGINLNRLQTGVNALASFRCGIPHLTSALFFLKNDIYAEARDARKNFPDGLYVDSLKNFCFAYPFMAERFYGKICDIKNPLVALNSLLVQDGIVVWVRQGVKVDFPIQIVSILESKNPVMVFRRILIIAEPDSEIKILTCDHTQTADVKFLNLQTVEVFAGENASVEICEMEESTEPTSRLSSMYIRQETGSKVSATGVTLYNGTTRNEYFSYFSGPNAHLRLSGMAIEDQKRSIDTFSMVEHTYPDCHTDELFKYVVDNESTATFSGLIKVEKGATKTEAYQNNRNIIGSEGARVYSKPRLEIYEDDVKCSHGSAIGQLDEKQIFYMRTRGLSEETAQFLLKQAFMADVIENIGIPDFRLRLNTLVERRFSGASNNCLSCKSNCLPDD